MSLKQILKRNLFIIYLSLFIYISFPEGQNGTKTSGPKCQKTWRKEEKEDWRAGEGTMYLLCTGSGPGFMYIYPMRMVLVVCLLMRMEKCFTPTPPPPPKQNNNNKTRLEFSSSDLSRDFPLCQGCCANQTVDAKAVDQVLPEGERTLRWWCQDLHHRFTKNLRICLEVSQLPILRLDNALKLTWGKGPLGLHQKSMQQVSSCHFLRHLHSI